MNAEIIVENERLKRAVKRPAVSGRAFSLYARQTAPGTLFENGD
jgi:hypothetical protein